jgi:hypothetical protein
MFRGACQASGMFPFADLREGYSRVDERDESIVPKFNKDNKTGREERRRGRGEREVTNAESKSKERSSS